MKVLLFASTVCMAEGNWSYSLLITCNIFFMYFLFSLGFSSLEYIWVYIFFVCVSALRSLTPNLLIQSVSCWWLVFLMVRFGLMLKCWVEFDTVSLSRYASLYIRKTSYLPSYNKKVCKDNASDKFYTISIRW